MTKKFRDLVDPIKRDPERRARVEQHKQAISRSLKLVRIRESQRITQQELARRTDVSQANISRIEAQDDLYLSTLRKYIEALGGKLEIHAVFPEGEYDLFDADETTASRE